MADDGKKDFTVDLKIDPFKEAKVDEVPKWFVTRPKLANAVEPIPVRRKLRLDPRKWKQKDLEEGVYAVAKYDLAAFATSLNLQQKELDKILPPKEQKKRKWKANDKAETKAEKEFLDTAEKKLIANWKRAEKSIEDKVSLALDEVEAGTNDNDKALKVGKEAFKIFSRLQVNTLFNKPIADVTKTMLTLAISLKNGSDSEEAYNVALRRLRNIEGDYEFTAKSTAKVAKMFLAIGERNAKDKNADKEVTDFGKEMSLGPIKKNMLVMIKNVGEVGRDLDSLVHFVARKEGDVLAVAQRAVKFKKEHMRRRGSATATLKTMRDLSDKFKKIEKKLK